MSALLVDALLLASALLGVWGARTVLRRDVRAGFLCLLLTLVLSVVQAYFVGALSVAVYLLFFGGAAGVTFFIAALRPHLR